jgi:hypothetical protein
MKKTIVLTMAAAGLMFGASFTGVISDSGCKGDHKAMNMGNDEQCTSACVKAHGAQYVLWDGKNAYTLSDQKAPEKFAGKKVTVMGTLDAKNSAIKVDSMKAAQ